MALWCEHSLVGSVSLSLFELTHNSQDKKSFSIDLGDLHITMWVSIEKQLTRNGFWKRLEKLLVLWRESVQDVFLDLTFEFNGKDLINLLDEQTHLWDELDETLWHKDHTVVLASVRSLTNDFNNLIGDVAKGLVLVCNFLTDQAAVSSGLQRALKSNMRGRSTHESNEVIILA